MFRSLALSPLSPADAGRLVIVGVAFTVAGMLLSALAQPLFRLPHQTFAACFQCGFRRQIAVVMAAVPMAPSAYILAVQMNGVGAPVALLISSGTLLASLTLPLWIAAVT